MYRMGQEEIDAVARVLESKSLFRVNSRYDEVNSFEREWREKIGAGHCLLVTSGTSAITAALVALGVGPGDEVIVPGHTFVATAAAVLAVGAIPVLCDIDDTCTLDPKDLERKVSGRTKAVIPVHIMGLPCDMDAIMALARRHGFAVVEDACQSVGGSYKGRRLGSIGDCGAFSFNWFKIISAGEGGALVARELDVYERAVIHSDCGSNHWAYDQPLTEPKFNGANYRVSEITGAILRVQMKRLDGILADLRRVRDAIRDGIRDVVNIARCNDWDGACGQALLATFGTAEAAAAFAEKTGTTHCINTSKHVYVNWAPVMNKFGAYNPRMDPYKNPLNQGTNMDFGPDSLPQTLNVLSRSVYIGTDPEWDEAKIAERIALLRASA